MSGNKDQTVIIAFHSGYGHTRRLAEALAAGAGSVDRVRARLLAVDAIDEAGWQALATADAIVFGAPTYMGGASAQFKAFADASAKIWFTQGWKDKLAGGFTCSGSMSGDKLSTLQYLVTFAMQHGMLWAGPALPAATEPGDPDSLNRLGSWLGLMAQADNVPPDESPPEGDIASAHAYGERIGRQAARLG
ncbi:MAG: flavodoxin family protein [Burkholderiaceae bacterium]